MFKVKRINLAFRMLFYKKSRLLISVCGVAFAVLIMFMELGFLNGLVDSQSKLITLFDADIVMLHKKQRFINDSREFPYQRIFQASVIDGIKEVIPVYFDSLHFFNPQTGMEKSVAYISFPIEKNPLLISEVEIYRNKLKIKNNVLFDSNSRKNVLGDIKPGEKLKRQEGEDTLNVIGNFKLGANFIRDGYLIAGDNTIKTDGPSFGLIRLKESANINEVKMKLIEHFPDDVSFLTIKEVFEKEDDFFTKQTPSGIIFGVGLLVGLIIGIIICYQILFNEIMDYLPQYATLKAVGFSNKYLISVVMKEALLLSIVGFIPGTVCTFFLYTAIEHFTSIVMFLTLNRILFIFGLTILMSCVSGILAVKKVIRLDPAELF